MKVPSQAYATQRVPESRAVSRHLSIISHGGIALSRVNLGSPWNLRIENPLRRIRNLAANLT